MPLVSVVITAHGEARDLPVILGSLENQQENVPGKNSRDGSEYFWAPGPRCELPIEVVVTYDGHPPEIDLWSGLSELSLAYAYSPKGGPPGHHTREPGIKVATGGWIVLTNMDNYFVKGWRHRIEELISNPRMGVVYWNVLSNLWRWSNFGGTQLRRGYADLSCCAIRAEIAKQVGFKWRTYDGDWDYIEACVLLAQKNRLLVRHIAETLSIHN